MWKYCAGVDGYATRMIALGAELEEPLETRARVFGPLPFVAVRKQQHDAESCPHFARSAAMN